MKENKTFREKIEENKQAIQFYEQQIEEVKDYEKVDFDNSVRKAEKEVGKVSQPDRVRFAIDAMVFHFTIEQIKDLTGAGRETVRKTIIQEQIRDNCRIAGHIADGKQGRNPKVYFSNGDDL